MPALLHSAIASRASGRGGSTMPTIASSVRSSTNTSRSPPGSNVAGSKSRRATTMTRSPALAIRSFSSSASWRLSSVTATRSASGIHTWAPRSMRTSGAPLTKQRTMGRSCASVISWKVAMNLYSESNGTSAIRGKRLRASSTLTPPFSASTMSAPSVGSPMSASPSRRASAHNAIGSMISSSGSALPPSCNSCPLVL
jgi:hypothetical protein